MPAEEDAQGAHENNTGSTVRASTHRPWAQNVAGRTGQLTGFSPAENGKMFKVIKMFKSHDRDESQFPLRRQSVYKSFTKNRLPPRFNSAELSIKVKMSKMINTFNEKLPFAAAGKFSTATVVGNSVSIGRLAGYSVAV